MSSPPRAGSVSIENIAGQHANMVNGIYEPTSELSGGLPAYQKKGDADMWLEFYKMHWYLRSASNRGTSTSCASIEVDRPCLPQDCPAGLWRVNIRDTVFESSALVTAALLSQIPGHMQATVDQVQLAFDSKVSLA